MPMSRREPTFAQRTFRHRETGELAALAVRRAPGPSRELWWLVELLGPDGFSPVRGLAAITWVPTRAWAQRLWAERATLTCSVFSAPP
jgi:hypothetical protein